MDMPDVSTCKCYAMMPSLCFPCQVKIHLLHMTPFPHGEPDRATPSRRSKSQTPSSQEPSNGGNSSKSDCSRCAYYMYFIHQLTSELHKGENRDVLDPSRAGACPMTPKPEQLGYCSPVDIKKGPLRTEYSPRSQGGTDYTKTNLKNGNETPECIMTTDKMLKQSQDSIAKKRPSILSNCMSSEFTSTSPSNSPAFNSPGKLGMEEKQRSQLIQNKNNLTISDNDPAKSLASPKPPLTKMSTAKPAKTLITQNDSNKVLSKNDRNFPVKPPASIKGPEKSAASTVVRNEAIEHQKSNDQNTSVKVKTRPQHKPHHCEVTEFQPSWSIPSKMRTPPRKTEPSKNTVPKKTGGIGEEVKPQAKDKETIPKHTLPEKKSKSENCLLNVNQGGGKKDNHVEDASKHGSKNQPTGLRYMKPEIKISQDRGQSQNDVSKRRTPEQDRTEGMGQKQDDKKRRPQGSLSEGEGEQDLCLDRGLHGDRKVGNQVDSGGLSGGMSNIGLTKNDENNPRNITSHYESIKTISWSTKGEPTQDLNYETNVKPNGQISGSRIRQEENHDSIIQGGSSICKRRLSEDVEENESLSREGIIKKIKVEVEKEIRRSRSFSPSRPADQSNKGGFCTDLEQSSMPQPNCGPHSQPYEIAASMHAAYREYQQPDSYQKTTGNTVVRNVEEIPSMKLQSEVGSSGACKDNGLHSDKSDQKTTEDIKTNPRSKVKPSQGIHKDERTTEKTALKDSATQCDYDSFEPINQSRLAAPSKTRKTPKTPGKHSKTSNAASSSNKPVTHSQVYYNRPMKRRSFQ